MDHAEKLRRIAEIGRDWPTRTLPAVDLRRAMATGYVTRESMRKSLTNQPPRSDAIVARFEKVRDPAFAMSDTIFDQCPESPERTMALRKLEEAVMWAIKSIAINQDDIPDT